MNNRELKLLKKIHELIWKGDDLMEQDTLCELQRLVDNEILDQALDGHLKITQLSNGYIKTIEVIG